MTLIGLLSFSAFSARMESCSAFSLLYISRRMLIYSGQGFNCKTTNEEIDNQYTLAFLFRKVEEIIKTKFTLYEVVLLLFFPYTKFPSHFNHIFSWPSVF